MLQYKIFFVNLNIILSRNKSLIVNKNKYVLFSKKKIIRKLSSAQKVFTDELLQRNLVCWMKIIIVKKYVMFQNLLLQSNIYHNQKTLQSFWAKK